MYGRRMADLYICISLAARTCTMSSNRDYRNREKLTQLDPNKLQAQPGLFVMMSRVYFVGGGRTLKYPSAGDSTPSQRVR